MTRLTGDTLFLNSFLFYGYFYHRAHRISLLALPSPLVSYVTSCKLNYVVPPFCTAKQRKKGRAGKYVVRAPHTLIFFQCGAREE